MPGPGWSTGPVETLLNWLFCSACHVTWHKDGGIGCFLCTRRGDPADSPDIVRPMIVVAKPDVDRLAGVW